MSCRQWTTRRVLLAGITLTLATGLSLSSCTAGESPGGEAEERVSAPTSRRPSEQESASIEPKPLKPLKSDDANGPRHRNAFDTNPSATDLVAAASKPASRRSAEEFAILFNHALMDRGPDSPGSEAVSTLTLDLPADQLKAIEAARPPDFVEAQVVPASRAWIRSAVGDEDPQVISVYVVEKTMVLAQDAGTEPFVWWTRALVTLSRDENSWKVIDYTSAVASEAPEFTQFTWDVIMDRGVGWRRFRNA